MRFISWIYKHPELIIAMFFSRCYSLDPTEYFKKSFQQTEDSTSDSISRYNQLLRHYLDNIQKNIYHDHKIFNNNSYMRDFLKEIDKGDIIKTKNENEAVTLKESSRTEEDSLRFEEFKDDTEGSTSKTMNTERAKDSLSKNEIKEEQEYREVIEKLYDLEPIFKDENAKNDFIYDFESNKPYCLFEYMTKKTEIVFADFWVALKTKKLKMRNMKKELRNIYISKNQSCFSETEYNYILCMLAGFLSSKYNFEDENDPINSNILDIIIYFCGEMGIEERFIPKIINKSTDKNLNINDNYQSISDGLNFIKYQENEIDLQIQKSENANKIRNLSLAIEVNMLSSVIDVTFDTVTDMDQLFTIDPKSWKFEYKKLNCYETYVLFINLYQATKVITKLRSRTLDFYKNNEIYIRSQLIYFTKSMIIAYRIIFSRFFMASFDLQTIKEPSDNISFFVYINEFSFKYVQFVFYAYLFTTFNLMIPKNLRNFCLDANLYFLNLFYLCFPEKIRYIDFNNELRKKMFKTDLYEFINKNINDFSKDLIEIFKSLDTSLYQNLDILNLSDFFLTCITFQKEFQNILKLNLFSFKETFPNYIQDFINERKLSERKLTKIAKIWTKNEYYFGLDLYSRMSKIEKESKNIFKNYTQLENFLKNSKLDVDGFLTFQEILNIIDKLRILKCLEIDYIDCDFLNTDNLYIYDFLYSNPNELSILTFLENFRVFFTQKFLKIESSEDNNLNEIFQISYFEEERVDVMEDIENIKEYDFIDLLYIIYLYKELEHTFYNYLSTVDGDEMMILLDNMGFTKTESSYSILRRVLCIFLYDISKQTTTNQRLIQTRN